MEEINNILKDVFKLSDQEILQDLTMENVERWDSITHMDMIVGIEDKTGVQLSGDDIAEMISLNAIRNIVSKYL
ncbi:MAG: acyl carrier protein [Bacteroidales bacterium]|nr:acyl carrier protein [Bacteroidales bacterium]